MASGQAFNEHEILTKYALRFSGHQYLVREWSEKEYRSALDVLIADLVLPAKPYQGLCLLFHLQQFLYKWGGERRPPNGYDWRAFRHLFLNTAHIDPQHYRIDSLYREWRDDYFPHVEAHVEFIRSVHEATVYDPNAPLLP